MSSKTLNIVCILLICIVMCVFTALTIDAGKRNKASYREVCKVQPTYMVDGTIHPCTLLDK